MRAVTIQNYGDADGMALSDDLPEPVPSAGQLLIGVEAIGVGGVDAVIRRGTLGSGFPIGHVPGSEVAGRVLDVGDGVDRTWIGRAVWAFTGVGGAYAERALASLDDVTALPDHLSAIDAVTLGSAGPVAHFALRHARLAAGESLLIRGAAGSIGIMAVQLATASTSTPAPSRIAVTTSSPERADRLRALGANELLDRAGIPIATSGAASDLDEYDVVLDIVGGAALPAFLDRLASNGRLVSIGVVAGYPPADFGMSLLRSFQRSRSFATFSLDTVPIVERNRVRAEQFDAAARGELQPIVHDVLSLSDAADAHRQMDAGAVFGRIVLTP